MLWLSWPSCILLVVLLMTSSAQPKIVSTDVGSLVFKRWPLELILRSVRGNLIRLFLQSVSCCAYWVCRPLDGFSYRGSNPPCLPSRGPTWLIWNIWTWNISERVEDIWASDSKISAFSGLPDWNLSFFIFTFCGGYFSATAAALEPREWADLSVEFLSHTFDTFFGTTTLSFDPDSYCFHEDSWTFHMFLRELHNPT